MESRARRRVVRLTPRMAEGVAWVSPRVAEGDAVQSKQTETENEDKHEKVRKKVFYYLVGPAIAPAFSATRKVRCATPSAVRGVSRITFRLA